MRTHAWISSREPLNVLHDSKVHLKPATSNNVFIFPCRFRNILIKTVLDVYSICIGMYTYNIRNTKTGAGKLSTARAMTIKMLFGVPSMCVCTCMTVCVCVSSLRWYGVNYIFKVLRWKSWNWYSDIILCCYEESYLYKHEHLSNRKYIPRFLTYHIENDVKKLRIPSCWCTSNQVQSNVTSGIPFVFRLLYANDRMQKRLDSRLLTACFRAHVDLRECILVYLKQNHQPPIALIPRKQ